MHVQGYKHAALSNSNAKRLRTAPSKMLNASTMAAKNGQLDKWLRPGPQHTSTLMPHKPVNEKKLIAQATSPHIRQLDCRGPSLLPTPRRELQHAYVERPRDSIVALR